MDFTYKVNDIAQGNRNKRMAEETPNSFGEAAGMAMTSPVGAQGQSTRMAGPVGARAMELATNPEEKQRTKNWMQSFGLSNEGTMFNQSRMAASEPEQTSEPANETKQPEGEAKAVTPEPKVKEEMK